MPRLTLSTTGTCCIKRGVHCAAGEVSPGKRWHLESRACQEGLEGKQELCRQRKE